jgi:hypothetical protein
MWRFDTRSFFSSFARRCDGSIYMNNAFRF